MALGRSTASRTRGSKSNTTHPPGPTNVPWPGEEESNTVVNCHRNSCNAAHMPSARRGQDGQQDVFKRVQAPERSRNKAALRVLLAKSCEVALTK